MVVSINEQKLYINSPKARKFGGINCYEFYTSLGKKKGYLTCRVWNSEHDFTKIKFIERVRGDFTSYTGKDGRKYYQLKILTYAELKPENFLISHKLPVKQAKVKEPVEPQEMVDINEELPPMEEFDDLQKEQLINIIDEYKKQQGEQ